MKLKLAGTKKSLVSRLVGAYLLITVATVSLASLTSFLVARSALEHLIVVRLDTVLDHKAEMLTHWIREIRWQVGFLADNLRDELKQVGLDDSPITLDQGAQRFERLSICMRRFCEAGPNVYECSLLSPVGGLVFASSNPGKIGRYRTTYNYFTHGRTQPYLEPVYPDAETSKPVMTYAMPIMIKDGYSAAAVLVAHLDLERIDRIINNKIGLGENGEAYLVDRYNMLISSRRGNRQTVSRGGHTKNFDQALAGREGYGKYTNYAGRSVIGVYRWLDPYQVALLAEMPRREAWRQATNLTWIVVMTGLLAISVMTLGVLRYSRKIAQPILAMAAAAADVAQGNLSSRAPVYGNDEIGMLADTFNKMTSELATLYHNLEARVKERTEELQASNKALKEEIGERKKIADQLRQYQQNLEAKVNERTAELANTNIHLHQEILERKKAERNLAESNKKLFKALDDLQQAQQQLIHQERLGALGQMASGVAHDFNNALQPITLAVDLLNEEKNRNDPVKREELIYYISEAAKAATATVKRLVRFYRPAEQQHIMEQVDIGLLIRDVVSFTTPKWKDEALSRGKTIRIDLELDAACFILGNGEELREVLINLIFNAIDAVERQGMIALRCVREDGAIHVEVEDTGCGMSADVQAKCFEPFFTTKQKKGTGLGMSIVYGIIKRHHGTIAITSATGCGTRIGITLPALPEEEVKPPEDHDVVPAVVHMEHSRILLAEDDANTRLLLTEVIENLGHAITSAVTGVEAWELFQKQTFDMVITDQAMPEMPGDELAAQIKRISPAMPVIMLTGFGALSDELAHDKRHVDIMLSKPLEKNKITQAIGVLLSRVIP